MTGKHIEIGARPAADWVRHGDGVNGAADPPPKPYTARLTIDVTQALRGRIKIAAFRQGKTVAEMVRALLERDFPDTDTAG